jgi:hypothetical protein
VKLNTKDNFKLCVLAITTIASELITLGTLGSVNLEWRAKLLFSHWMDTTPDPWPMSEDEL